MDVAQLARVELPTTLSEAVERLNRILDPNDKRTLMETPKDDLEVTYQFGLGTAIRNAFELHSGNPALLASCGASHPNNASTVIIEALWDRLQKEPCPSDHE